MINNHYKTIVISDLHLGTVSSKTSEVIQFLKKNKCNTLIMNGDIIDGWQLRKSGKWEKKHTRFFKILMKIAIEDKTQIYYLRGNHDDFIDQVAPLQIMNFHIRKYLIYHSSGKKYYIVHGDIFDHITSNAVWLSKLGDIGYNLLLWINKKYNERRKRNNLSYHSISQVIKERVKFALNFIFKFEMNAVKLAKLNHCDGIICGHIHKPAIREIDGIMYMNSGDWVESMSALTEDHDGNWTVQYFNPFESENNYPETAGSEIFPAYFELMKFHPSLNLLKAEVNGE
ncbi:MAG: UDP-2,3-diacylglucosamine diphosphatase [Bacteroidia bacterium]|nr:UDP-2,3-diacylglucosamine diphosphatase [Bacteroidia bacterium]